MIADLFEITGSYRGTAKEQVRRPASPYITAFWSLLIGMLAEQSHVWQTEQTSQQLASFAQVR